MFTSGVTSEGPAVLGLRKFRACSAVSVGRLTLVEGGLVWRLVAGTWAFVFCIFCRLIRTYTSNDTGANVLITTRLYSKSDFNMFQVIKTTKISNMWPI